MNIFTPWCAFLVKKRRYKDGKRYTKNFCLYAESKFCNFSLGASSVNKMQITLFVWKKTFLILRKIDQMDKDNFHFLKIIPLLTPLSNKLYKLYKFYKRPGLLLEKLR